MVSQTGNPQGEVPLLPRPASGVVTTYCFCVWSVASWRFCAIATVFWRCAGFVAPEFAAAAIVGRQLAAAVMPLPSSPDMAKPGANAISLDTVRTTTHHLPHSGCALSGQPLPPVTNRQATANAATRATYLLGIYLRAQGSRITLFWLDESAALAELHSSSTSSA
jgi:hypothetical protein